MNFSNKAIPAIHRTLTLTLLVAALATLGCDTAPPRATGVVEAGLSVSNGNGWNGVGWNGNTWNGGTWNGQGWNGLFGNGLFGNGSAWNGRGWNGSGWQGMGWNGSGWNGSGDETRDVAGLQDLPLTGKALAGSPFQIMLEDEELADTFSYVVSCALAEDQAVEMELQGVPETFPGGMGLAPEWGDADGYCDEDCQEWVSSCLMARVNAHGEHILISMRGGNGALALGEDEAVDFPHPEATYYGNIFSAQIEVHACLPDGETGIPRVCGDSLDDCFLDIEGACSDVCTRGACRDADDNVFPAPLHVFNSDETYEHYYGTTAPEAVPQLAVSALLP